MLLVCCCVLGACKFACAQEIERVESPLIDQQPFDLITLNAAAGGESVKVLPLAFSGRQVPTNPKPTDKLEVVLVRFPEREYEVAWKDIARIDLYEQRIYEEARQKMVEKDFIAAFQNLSFLMRNYPRMPRLEELRREFLLKSAADRYQAGELRQTLSALEELRATAPDYQATTVLRVLSQVADSLITAYQQAGDLGSAKALLNRLRRQYGAALPVIESWQKKLDAMALAKRDEALQWLRKREYRQARQAAMDMLSISADVAQAEQLLKQIIREHPLVRVGVMQRANDFDPSSLTDWSARRAGQLVQQTLIRFLETGAEGGRYAFALGTFRLSDDRQQLMFSIDPSISASIDAFNLAQTLLARGDPASANYDPSWAAIFDSVAIQGTGQVLVQLKRPNVLPHALLQWRAAEDTASSETQSGNQTVDQLVLTGEYRVQLQDSRETSFALRESVEQRGQPVEIVEVFYDDPKLAINDLLRGNIDMIDQLYPADAKRLAADPRVRVGSYALPSTHMLIPLSDHAYLANSKFRRALLYATNRQAVLEGELLGSDNLQDGRLVSGPFPLGGGLQDPLAYAYNTDVAPAEYNPQLAKLLLFMTEQELRESAKRNHIAEPKLEKLKVACPDFEFARVAVQAMIQQWAIVGIEAEMSVFDPRATIDDESPATSPAWDLLYATTTMWEPATDIERLLGAGGLAASHNPFIVQGLEKLRTSRNWREVRTALQDLHQLIDYHLPVLPLWQVTDRYAVNRYIEGVDDYPVSLYQDVSDWRIDFERIRTAAR